MSDLLEREFRMLESCSVTLNIGKLDREVKQIHRRPLGITEV